MGFPVLWLSAPFQSAIPKLTTHLFTYVLQVVAIVGQLLGAQK